MQQNNSLQQLQSSFCKKHSKETALVKVSSDILISVDFGEYIVFVLLDLSCAFDTTDYIMINRHENMAGIKQWLRNSYLLLNSDKTKTQVFVPESKVPQIKQQFSALGLSVQRSYKDLGVVLD